jgi:hemoglobin
MKQLFGLTLAFAGMIMLAGPGTTYAQHDDPDMEWEEMADEAPLIERIGGAEKLRGVVEDFVSMVMADEKLKSHFEKADKTQWTEELKGQLTRAAGGETTYEGKTLKESLGAAGINGESLGSVAEHLMASLEKHEVTHENGEALLTALELKKTEPEQK